MATSVEADDAICIWEEGELGGDDIREDEVGGDENVEPFVGMEFTSDVEARQFYISYGYRLRFSVRVNTNTKAKDGLSSVRMICSKHGLSKRQKQEEKMTESDDNLGTPQKEMPNKTSGCMAYIRFRRIKSGVWVVSAFNASRNHMLLSSPAKKRNLRSLKGMTLEERDIVSEMRAQNVSTSQIWHYLAEKAGGIHKLHFKMKDVSNVIAQENRRLVGIDVETTLMYFHKKREEDPEIYFAIESNENGVAKNIFWVDGRVRRAYAQFGDVVTFDTTYNTNKYCMPLGVFIGVNHHWQSIIFGCCLLRNEQATNFNWLFSTWMQAMRVAIKDPAMRVAIKEVLPNTVHRCCQWHVLRKAREQLLVHYGTKEGFEEELKNIIIRSLTVADFETSWNKMLQKYSLEDNNHLKTMYDK